MCDHMLHYTVYFFSDHYELMSWSSLFWSHITSDVDNREHPMCSLLRVFLFQKRIVVITAYTLYIVLFCVFP